MPPHCRQVPSNLLRSCRRWSLTAAQETVDGGACLQAVQAGHSIGTANERNALECVEMGLRVMLHIVHLTWRGGAAPAVGGVDVEDDGTSSQDDSAAFTAARGGQGWHVPEANVLEIPQPAAVRVKTVFRVEQKSPLKGSVGGVRCRGLLEGSVGGIRWRRPLQGSVAGVRCRGPLDVMGFIC